MKFYLRCCLLFLVLFSLFATQGWAQTITITNFDPGPYSRGSAIAVPFHVDDAAGCIGQTNTFNLYLSNAAGVYSATPLATVSGFYATFINATIPATTPAGSGYKVKVTSTSNPTAIGESQPFTITTGAAVKASIISSQSIDNGLHSDVFGNCNNVLTTFNFTDNSTNVTTINADFINESLNAYEATVNLAGAGSSGSYNPDNTNYTIIVRASNGTTHSTKAYTLINNPKNSTFGFSGTQNVCLGSTLTFNIDITSADGIQFNYPGNTYKFDWGDGSNNVLTLCQIQALNGHIDHQYLTSSCGNVVGTTQNAFKISFEPNNPYCGSFNAVSTTAKISVPPSNSISGPITACTGVPVQFTNTSYPGEDPASTQGNCIDFAGARYTWYVDGVIQTGFSGVPKSKIFNPSLTVGTHVIKLSLDNNQTSCSIPDATFQVCVQEKPVPSFTVPAAPVCLTGSTVTVPVTNTTIVDNSCFVNPYQWSVTGGTVTYAGGTSSASANPQFVFSAVGNYTINLNVTDACGNQIAAPQKQIIINGPPTPTFSGPPVANFCGPQTITFNNTVNSPTRITYTGTAPGTTTPTYLWTVTPQGGASPATFANGTTAASQYPQINFPDIGDYQVSVTYQNSCGIQAISQRISIQQAPIVSAGISETICPTAPTYTLNGTISDMSNVKPNGISWTKTINGVTNTAGMTNINTLTPTYTLSPGDAGKDIVFNLEVQTTLNQCSDIIQSVTIHITPTETVTSAATQTLCSGDSPNYTMTASNAGSTFTWTATGTANAAGFTANGSGNLINDALTTTNNNAATVTYTITPTSSNGCQGTAFTYTVTVNPLPVISPLNNSDLCSGAVVSSVLQPTANLPGTTYTWTSTASSPNITGYTNSIQAAAAIGDRLNNTGTTDETITYHITPVNAATGCMGTTVTVIVTVHPQPTQAIADPSATEEICAPATTFQLHANTPIVGTGKWTQTLGPATAGFDNDTDPQTTVRGLFGGNVYEFTWTITSSCRATSGKVKVINYAPAVGGTAQANNTTICQGDNTIITVSANAVGTIAYWESSADENTWTQVPGTANVAAYTYNGATAGTQYFRAQVQNGPCNPPVPSGDVRITITAPISGNSITGAASICYNAAPPLPITGSTPQGGNGNYSYQWQQSTDNGAHYNPVPGATGQDYQPGTLTATTYFERVVSSQICAGNTSSVSNPIVINVTPQIQATFTASVTSTCAPFNIGQNNNIVVTADPNVNYDWSIDDGNSVQHFTSAAFPGYTINQPGKSVVVTLTATNTQTNSCQKITSVTFSTVTQVTPVLSLNPPSSGCADANTTKFTVGFKNMSTPSGGSFTWNFGDGSPVYTGTDLQLSHNFAASTDGSDKTYTVTLTPVDCNVNNATSTQVITVYPAKPVPSIEINHTDGCSGVSIVVHNKTLGTNDSYTYYLRDENNAVVQTITRTNNDKSDVTFNPVFAPNNFVTYSVTMTAVNLCGVSANSNAQILTISPSNISATMSVTPVQQSTHTVSGCAPFQVTFHNTSFGGTTYTYHIFKDGVQQPDVRDDRPAVDYTFLEPGTYTVSLNVSSTCATGVESAPVTITVNSLPTPDFTASTTTCSQPFVQFTNNTLNENNLPAISYSYLWDFGDGTTSDQFTPSPHNYSANHSPYTVKLTATNNNGCSFTTTKVAYVVISASPGTDFSVRPDSTISIPNYRFSFEDESVSAVSWSWDFGDNTTSAERNPTHTYADTGTYKVTLISTSAAGCSDSKVHTVHITGVPGQLYVPNAFMPTSLNNELSVFTIKGSGIKQWDMRIYNSWGQLIFETTKLNNKGEPVEFWDGRYKGQEMQQGGYTWEISATFINGTDWRGMSYKAGSAPKKAGIVNLIR